MKVQAEDTNGNVAERTFTIIREEFIPDAVFADVDIPKKTKMNNPDGIAVVIGVEGYQYVANATYAYNDAEVFREYLADTLGFKKSRIKIATNSKATQASVFLLRRAPKHDKGRPRPQETGTIHHLPAGPRAGRDPGCSG
jgi:hypothetical protein